MKLDGLLRLGIIGLVLGGLAGCDTIPRRIAEKREAYDPLPTDVKRKIREGYIYAGYTPEMVYMAQGKPAEISTSADGRETTWVYWYYVPPEEVRGGPPGMGHHVDKAFGSGGAPGDGRDGGGQVIPDTPPDKGPKMRRDLVVSFIAGRVAELHIRRTPE